MARLKPVIAVAYLTTAPLLRSPLWMAAQLVTPVGVVLTTYMLAGKSALLHVLVGALVSVAAGSCIGIARLLVLFRLIGFHDIIVASPVGLHEYMLGLALSRLLGSLPAITVFSLALSTVAGFNAYRLAVLALAILFAWLLTSLLAFTIALYVESPVHIDSITLFLSSALILLPPVYYPLDALPDALKPVAFIAPTTYAAEMIRRVLVYDEPLHWLLAAALAYAAILSAVVSRRLAS
ncbi:ABC transporter permease [Pyrodictium abyssi]|uniref:ABC transporter permease n=1 Tax=Pyrodictium abyssi TaxID=54256 RepID=A0ABM8IXA7_9CREN|nr:ABC transporter permease [Pyrodictium abyssi]